MPLNLMLNGRPQSLPTLDDGAKLAQVLTELGFREDRIAVERNAEIVSRKTWADVEIGDGDRLEIVHFVGGGLEAGWVKSMRRSDAFGLRRPAS